MVVNGLDRLRFMRLGSTKKVATKPGYSLTPDTVTPVPSSLGMPFEVTTLPVLCKVKKHVADTSTTS